MVYSVSTFDYLDKHFNLGCSAIDLAVCGFGYVRSVQCGQKRLAEGETDLECVAQPWENRYQEKDDFPRLAISKDRNELWRLC